MEKPLDGIRVISMEHAIAAPFCSRQLADLGARVIKIERPVSGDFARNYDLEEHKINSNNSIGAKTWIGGSKFEIYPQHIPGMLY